MKIRVLRFITLLLAALGLIMGGAHVLELVPKLHYDARLYEQVTSTMYRYFGIAGGIIQVLAIVFAAILTVAVRARPGFRFTLAGAICLAVSLGLWFALVQPVNQQWANALATTPIEAVQTLYAQLRSRWEWGHVAAFTFWFCGTCMLLLSVLVEIPVEINHKPESKS